MASKLIAIASNPTIAMACNQIWPQPDSDGLQTNSDGLQPNSDGLQPTIAMASKPDGPNLIAMASRLTPMARWPPT